MKEREEFKRWLMDDGAPFDGNFAREAADGWKELGADKFDVVMDSIDKSIDERTGQKKNNDRRIISFSNWKWMGIAATLLIAVTAWWFLASRPANPDQLFATYYQPRTHPDAMVRGEEDNIREVERNAVNAYVDGDYKTAIKQYESLVSRTPADAKHVLFLAISYLGDGQESKTISILDDYTAKGNPYEADMRWYLALAYLKHGSINTSKSLLENLAAGESYYSGSAKELLSAME